MNTLEFMNAVNALTRASALAHDGQLSPLEHSRQREAALASALAALAESHGVRLRQPLYIDSNGDFDIVTVALEGSPWDTKVPYGKAFADLLTRYSPRTGVSPGAHLLPENQWCWLNHFSAEKMVMEQAQVLDSAKADPSVQH